MKIDKWILGMVAWMFLAGFLALGIAFCWLKFAKFLFS